MLKRALPGAGVLVVVAGLFLQGCESNAAPGRVYTKPPGYVLAAMDVGSGLAENDPRVEAYSTLLSEIRGKCKNSLQEISDITIDVLMTLHRKGVSIDVYELLRRVNDAMPPPDHGTEYDYRQIATAFKTLGSS